MAKKSLRLVSAALALIIAAGTAVSASAVTVPAVESAAAFGAARSSATLASQYKTNPNGFGKEATIKIDGDASDWSSDMLIAQGAAWDVANHWKGGHENCVLDTYALYGAWDDENLYIGWQMVNTTDTWARSGDGPLSDGGRVLDVPLILALSVDPSSTAMSNKNTDGNPIWGQKLGLEFDTHVDRLLYMSGKPGLGEPSMFSAVDANGNTNYTTGCVSFANGGIEYKMATTNISSEIIGLNNSDDPSDVTDDGADWVDYKTFVGSAGVHDTTYDSFYEIKIPLATLGIDKAYITKNGIGAMLVATRGESALDCIPYDLSMVDNAKGDYASDPSTSHEKDDNDIITAALARVGNGDIIIPDTDTSKKNTDSEKKVTDSDKKETDSDKKDSDTDKGGTGDLNLKEVVTATAKKGDTVEVTLSASGVKDLFGISNTFTYDSSKFEVTSVTALEDGVEYNKADGTVKWNANLGDGKKGVDVSSGKDLIKITMKALADVDGTVGTNETRDAYSYDFTTITTNTISGTAKVSSSGKTDSDTDKGDSKITVTANANKDDTVKVTLSADLTKVEGISNEFTYDSSKYEFVSATDNSSESSNLVVQHNQKTGSIKWNVVNAGATGKTDLITFEFIALTSGNNTVGTNVVNDIYDADNNTLDYKLVTAKADVISEIVNDSIKVDVNAKKGDTVIVYFKAKDAKDALGLAEIVDYDASSLKFVSGESLISDASFVVSAENEGRVAVTSTFNGKGIDLSSETDVYALTFTVLKDVATSDPALYYYVEEFYNTSYADFNPNTTTSALAVVGESAKGDFKVNVDAKQGDTVTVAFKAKNAKDALGLAETISYDGSALRYTGMVSGLGNVEIKTDVANEIKWSTLLDAKGTDLTSETDVLVLTFTALKDISANDSVLAYTVDEFYDVSIKDFDAASTTSAVATTESKDNSDTDSDKKDSDNTDSDKKDSDNTDTDPTHKIEYVKLGDVNGDGNITTRDALTVQRYVIGLVDLDEKAKVAADVDEDGKITARDSLAILRYILSLKTNASVEEIREILILIDLIDKSLETSAAAVSK